MRQQLNIIGKHGLAWLGSLNEKTVEKERERTSNCSPFVISYSSSLNSSQFICTTVGT